MISNEADGMVFSKITFNLVKNLYSYMTTVLYSESPWLECRVGDLLP